MTLLAASALLFTACTKDNPAGNESGKDDGPTELTFNASRENFTWSEGDALSVFDGESNNIKFNLTDGAGKSGGKFSATVSSASGSFVSLHPYQKSASYSESDGKLSGVVLKSEQTAVAGDIDPEAAVMTAVSSKSGSNLTFKDAVGYVKLVTGFACTKITLSSNNPAEALAGTMDISLSLSGVPTPVLRPDSSVSQLSLTGTIAAGSAYYLALCPVTVSGGYSLVFTAADGSEKRKDFTDELIITQGKTVDLGKFDEEQFADKTPYVTFSAESGQIFKMSLVDGIGSLEYSVAGGDWKTVVSEEGVAFGGSAGELRLRGKSVRGTAISPGVVMDGDSQRAEYSQISFADSGVPVAVSGDIRTLIDWENYETASTADAKFCSLFNGCSSLDSTLELPATVLADYCYDSLFSGCALTTAPALPATTLSEGCYHFMFSSCPSLWKTPELPATELKPMCYRGMFSNCPSLWKYSELPATSLAESCYALMFQNCTSLSSAPALPATTLSEGCYSEMFSGCSSLTPAPELPATSLAASCYRGMFSNCPSLWNAPELPATNLANDCYNSMFSGCSSLTSAPALPATTLSEYCYSQMFQGCGFLTSAPALPATTLSKGCYSGMFTGCSSLTEAPELPATSLAASCYSSMFDFCYSLRNAPALPATDLAFACYSGMFAWCSSLTTAPALPATELAYGCYISMFAQCSNLRIAPELPATTLAEKCYAAMFSGCSNLNEVTIKATDASAKSALSNWLDDVASSGTIHKRSKLDLPADSASGIPTGWTAVDDVTY